MSDFSSASKIVPMTEVRNEVIVATAVLITALVAVIGYQYVNGPQKKAAFAPKKAQCEAKSAKEIAEARSAPNKDILSEEKIGGRILEK